MLPGRCTLLSLLLLCLACHASQSHAAKPYIVALTLSGSSRDMIGDALQSAVAWVDRIVLIDTGIKDDTLDVAKKIVGNKLTIKTMKWPGSFSDARNAALQIAADEGGSWGVFLDTDERFVGDTTAVRKFLQITTADMINMRHDSQTYQKPRFYRLPVKGTYVGPTHESFILAPGATSADISGVMFSEVPRDEEGYRHKARRDVAILTKHIAANPTDARWFYYLGDAYAILGEHEKAVAAFHKCTDLRGWDEEGAWAMYRAAQILNELERYDDAVEALAKGMSRHPAIPELPWYAAYLSWKNGKHQQAIWWARLATVHGCYKGTCPKRHGFEYPFARYEGPYNVLYHSWLALGDTAGAAAAKLKQDKAIEKREGGSRTTKPASARDSKAKTTALADV